MSPGRKKTGPAGDTSARHDKARAGTISRGASDESRVPKQHPQTIIILSGGTGHTADQVIGAALAQFEGAQVEVIRKARVRSVRAATELVRWAAERRAILCHTLVVPKIRAAVTEHAQRLGVPTVDILGPMLTVLDDQLGIQPRGRPGLSYELHKEHFDRVDAVDFTLSHDDGRRIEDLARADVVLVGVSRVSKSVTCFYLAARGIRAANVPLVFGCDPPEPLLRLDPRKVIGITMNANRLQSIREARLRHITTEDLPGYVDKQQLVEELRYAQALMSQHHWRCIDVSYSATEEVAHEIISMISHSTEARTR
jgi:regulator of PEP synthase PpsR (kinase-PPPase family)